jgi:protein-disulfide isomerase
MLNKGTAIVGFLLSFLAGSGLMWGVARYESNAPRIIGGSASASPHAGSPIPIGDDDPSWGDPDAPVTVVLLSDFECPYCSRVGPILERIRKEYGPRKVHLVWKNNPLPGHPSARPTAVAAATVQALGGDFWKFHDLAFSHQRELTRENLKQWAVSAGADAAAFDAAMGAQKYAGKVDRDLALARQIGANSTPAFRVNGKVLSGALPFETFKALIDEQLAAASALAKSGVAASRLSVELTKKNFTATPARPEAPQKRPEDRTVWRIPVAADDPVRGPADALVTIVEFSEFQCPYCSRVGETLTRLEREYAADLRFVWKDAPATFHPRAKPAAQLARVAYQRGGERGFWTAHDALFAAQKNLDDAAFEQLTSTLGLRWPEVRAEMASPRVAAKLAESESLVEDFAAHGTPYFFINGRRLVGAQPYDTFKALVDEQLGVARGLLQSGVRRSDVFKALMKDAKPAPPPDRKDVPPATADNPSRGAKNAKITIVEFSDFQCPFCSRVTPTVDQILAAYPKDVKVVWRHLPLPFHPDAPLAAEAAQEAFAQGGDAGFWKYHDVLFANQKALGRPELERHARELGLDMARFNAALDRHTHQAHIGRDRDAARQAGISSTPGFTINGYFISGAHPFEVFDRLIKRALKDS